MKKIELDVHTHTLASGHAYGTISEMAKAAAEKGLAVLGITEHAKGIPGTCEDIYFLNLGVVPRTLYGVQLLLGSEMNIVDYAGTLSLPPRVIGCLDVRIAGIHPHCYTYGTVAQNTAAVVGAICNPAVDIISHPDDGACPLDYQQVVRAAVENHTLLEINNNSLRNPYRKNVQENVAEILRLCKEYKQPVIMDSDAHFPTDVANLQDAEAALAAADFPAELVMNYNAKAFLAYLAENRKREQAQVAK